MITNINRYKPDNDGRLWPASDGEYVLYADHVAALALLPGEPVGYIDQKTLESLKEFGGLYRIESPKWHKDGDSEDIPLYASPAPLPVAVKALKEAEAEFNMIACEGVTETRSASDALERVHFFANRGAVTIRSALSSPVGGTEEPADTASPFETSQQHSDTDAAIRLGADVLARIEDPAAREIAIRNALTIASQDPSSNTRSDLYDADAFMADGGDAPMTAAENVLAWLIVEKIGVTDDVGYSPNQAQEIIVRRLEQVLELEQIDDMLNEGQGDDQGHPIMPEFTKGMTTYAKVEACLHLLERRRDALHPASDIAALREENRRLRNKVPARALTDSQLDDESAAIDEVMAGAIRLSGLEPHQNAPALKSFSKVDRLIP